MQSKTLRTEATPEHISRLRNCAAEAAARAGAAELTVAHVRLAVSEAATNAVLHAFAGDRPGHMRLDVAVEDDDLVVAVHDDGWGMRPRDDSPGLGLGLPLIARVSQRTNVASREGGGTTLRMWFPLDERLS